MAIKDHPVSRVQWVPIEKVEPNGYNPNRTAQAEMHLLYISIKSDGYTQPIVTKYDKERDKYVIVDGFHRYWVMKTQKDIYESTGGLLPIVVIDGNLGDLMASTIRHNRARGKHTVAGMSKLVFEMLRAGMSDADICNEIGLEPEELLKLKHITGFSKLFKDHQYSPSWESELEIRARLELERKNGKSGTT
jgi:ParB-like chromosome segregation protein Spo0J